MNVTQNEPNTQPNTEPNTASDSQPNTQANAQPVTQANAQPVTQASAQPVTQASAQPSTTADIETGDKPGAPAEGAAPAEPTGFVIEQGKRFSQSVLWQLTRDYYHQRGLSAWESGTVPSYVTSNPYIAQVYANLVFTYLKNCLAPVLLRETAAGSDAALRSAVRSTPRSRSTSSSWRPVTDGSRSSSCRSSSRSRTRLRCALWTSAT